MTIPHTPSNSFRYASIYLSPQHLPIEPQNNPLYLSPPLGTIEAAVWDLTSPTLPPGLEPGSVDILTLVFVMSALHPKEWANAVSNIHKVPFFRCAASLQVLTAHSASQAGRTRPHARLRPL